MGLLRSEEMSSGTLVLPSEGARHFLDVLGWQWNLQFIDVHANNTNISRPYRKYVQRIEEMERHVRFLFEECRKHDMTISTQDTEGFLNSRAQLYKLEQVEADLKKLY